MDNNNIKTIVDLSDLIKCICDDFRSGKISEDTAKNQIIYWAKSEGLKMFKGFNKLNPTLKKNIGKKRERLILLWTKDFIK